MTERLSHEAAPLIYQEILDQLSAEFGFSTFTPITAGERNVPLLRSTTENDKKMVIKIGFGGEEQRTEVENNIIGYQAIKELGAQNILPEELYIRTISDTPVIIMNDLGDDFGRKVKSNDFSPYDTFFSEMPKIYADSMHESEKDHLQGLQTVKDTLLFWHEQLREKGVLSNTISEDIKNIDIQSLAGSRSSIMLLDFTPDNVFVNHERVSFIDPWLQKTYLGSPIPSIGQFFTLAHDVHNYPGAGHYKESFYQLAQQAGDLLALSQEQIDGQFDIGAALQFFLSGYVRIGGGEDERGRAYLEKGKELITKIKKNERRF